jgi:hypothetical protein
VKAESRVWAQHGSERKGIGVFGNNDKSGIQGYIVSVGLEGGEKGHTVISSA